MYKFGNRLLVLCVVCLCLPAIAVACDPPYVGINGIGVGDTLSGVRTVALSVWSETEVKGVDVYLDGKLIASFTPALSKTQDGEYEGPCAFTWDTRTVPNGAHELYAKARALGREDGVSDTLVIVIDNPIASPDKSSTETEKPGRGSEEEGQTSEQSPDAAPGDQDPVLDAAD